MKSSTSNSPPVPYYISNPIVTYNGEAATKSLLDRVNVLSGASIRRKCHVSVMSSVIGWRFLFDLRNESAIMLPRFRFR
jgi:hypothetical protein